MLRAPVQRDPNPLIHCQLTEQKKTSLQYSVRMLIREVKQRPMGIINFRVWKTAWYNFVLSRYCMLRDVTLEKQNRK